MLAKLTSSLLLFSLIWAGSVDAQPITDTRRKMIENQRNINYLRKEKLLYQNELERLNADKPRDTQEYLAKAADLKDSINTATTLIYNLAAIVSEQRLLLTSLERGKAPSALDIALKKALNSNLPALAKNLANNEAAQREILILRKLLKQEAGIGKSERAGLTDIDIAEDQQVAEQQFLNLLALFSSGEADDSADKSIRISGIRNSAAYTESAMLSYLGHQQYHIETTVYSGSMTLNIDGRPWQLRIPDDENEATYMVIYDLRNADKPRLVMFNKALLMQ